MAEDDTPPSTGKDAAAPPARRRRSTSTARGKTKTAAKPRKASAPAAAKRSARDAPTTPVAKAKAGVARRARVVRDALPTLPTPKLPKVKRSTGAVVGAAAVGLITGLAATAGRKAASQAAAGLHGEWDVTLAAEHRAALAIFDRIQATAPTQATRRTTLLGQLRTALAKHAFEEEHVVYCALRDQHDASDADSLNHDHGYVKQYLFDLDRMPRHEPAWMAKVAEFRAAIEKHVRQEEDEIFPTLKSRLSADENAKLTTAMNRQGARLA